MKFNNRRSSLVFVIFSMVSGFSVAYGNTPTTHLGKEESLGMIHHAYIAVVDQISDGCWPSPSNARNRVSSKLEQAGVSTYDEHLAMYSGFSVAIFIEGMGYRQESGGCVGHINYSVEAVYNKEFGSEEYTGRFWKLEAPALLYRNSVIYSGGQDLNDRITSSVDSFTDDLITRIYSGRRDSGVSELIDNFESLTKEAMTRREFNEFVEKAMKEND